jgi:Na+-transporting NADH:ubiquinone oxidoreductase subunit NqrC
MMSENNSESRYGVILVILAIAIVVSMVVGLFVVAAKY